MADLIDKIIDNVIKEEVGNAPNGGYTNDPTDAGGRTQYGISEKSNPEAWADDKVTPEEARAIYHRKYVESPGFDRIPDPNLCAQLVDYGVTSGPVIAIRALQRCVGAEEDGVLGPETLHKLALQDSKTVNNKIVGERVKMIGRLVVKNKSQVRFLSGWLNRAVEFLR